MKRVNVVVLISLVMVLFFGTIIVEGISYEGDCSSRGGIFIADLGGGVAGCFNITDAASLIEYSCPSYVNLIYGGTPFGSYCGYEPPGDNNCLLSGLIACEPNTEKSLTQRKMCKLLVAESAYLGGTVKTKGLGAPSSLKMRSKETGVVYVLPLVTRTEAFSGIWEAEFATIDPQTGQPLVAPGEYMIYCYGEGGTASGSGQMITISR